MTLRSFITASKRVLRVPLGIVGVAACLQLGSTTLLAQTTAPENAASSPAFMPRYDFVMSAAALGHEDQRFTWDAHWAGDFDLVDYVRGRTTFVLDYQTILGSEFRPFDPYQSNYLLEAISTARLPRGVEVGGILNHVSRHLGDRFKRVAVAENSVGVRVWKNAAFKGQTTLALRGDLRKVIARAYDDYTWISNLDMTLRRQVRRRASIYGRVVADGILVDPTIAQRNRQYGGRAEVGVTTAGERGAVEFFGGFERMIDADPLDRVPRKWAFFGFRLRGH